MRSILSSQIAAAASAVAARQLRGVLSLWTWLVIGLALFGGFFAVAIAFALAWPVDRRRALCGRVFRLSSVVGTRLSPMWQFGVYGDLPAKSPRCTVVVGNHESAADPFLISYLPWEMKWLSKASMFSIPFSGWTMRMAGDVPVIRGDAASTRRAMRTCAGWLARGMPVMIFPEGTRAADGRMGPFKDGAFRLAIETGAEVLPIAVSGSARALPKHGWRVGFARAYVTVGEPIVTTGMTLADVEALKGEARARIEILRRRLDQHLSSGG